jgi:penicillin-binding protein 1A
MTQRARKRQRRSRRSVGKRILLGFGFVLFVLTAAGIGGALWFLNIWNSTPSIASLKPIRQGANSVVFAADGSRLGYVQSDTIRRPVHGSKIPSDLKNATVAIEDRNFYHHGGVDPSSIVRAGWADLKAGAPVQGGSTITQQLVRNLYIANPQEDIQRKIHEANLADQYESRYTKDQILNKYLNTASYGTTEGRTAVGVQAAAQTYFSEPVSHLTLSEAAMIAGLPQAPSDYNPFLNPRAALARRNQVLQAMVQQGYISQRDYEQAARSGIGLNRGYKYQSIREPYFFDYVTQELISRYGVNTVRNGGLKVYTTINPQLQADAQNAIANNVIITGPARALVSIDATNGHIVAMASSQPYSPGSQFNLAADAHRQPGSSFKPYVLATAIKQGMDPDTTYYSGKSPVTLSLDDGTTWTVNNAEAGGGTMSVRDATVHSVNAIFAQLDLDVGPDAVKQTAASMGITSPLDGIPAEGIGGLRVGVTPLEQADAYATFADGGVHHPATAISKVVFPNGKADVPDQGEAARALSDGVAYEVTDVLKGVLESGTAAGQGIGCPAAGKTGTTDDYTDAWFVGYTPRLSTAVWVGYPDARTTMGGSAFGGTLAAPIWQDYMSVAHGSYCDDFPQAQSPVQFSSSWSGAHAVSSGSSSYSTSGGTAPAPTYTPPSDSGTGDYPSQYYAPGAGQEPAPSPAPDTSPGNSGGGGGPPGGAPPGNPGGGTGAGAP